MKSWARWAILLVALVVLTRPGLAVDLRVAAGVGRPVLDGRLNDACWRDVQWAGGFLTEEARPAVNQTRFAVCHDAQGLYLAIECPQAAAPVVSSQAAVEEKSVFAGDVVEVFLQPGGDNRIYYHFVADAAGNRYDAKLYEEGGNQSRDLNWGANWEARAARTPAGWALECAFPWDSLPLTSDKHREWRLNVARENVSEPAEIASWCRGAFARRESFGHLTGLTADLTPYVTSVGRAAVRQQYTLSGTEVAYAAELTNPLPAPLPLRARLSEGSPEGRVLSEGALTVPAGKSALLSLPLREAPAPGTALCLRLLDGTGRPRITRLSRLERQQEPPLRLKLTSPAFRNTIYPTERLTQVEGWVTVAAAPAVLAQSKLIATLTGPGQTLSRQVLQPLQSRMVLRLPLGAPAEGVYRLQLSLQIAGRQREALDQPITRLKPGPTEVRVDGQGRFVFHGKPGFPLLIYSSDMTPAGLRELKAAGFNVAHTYYMGYYFPVEQCLKEFGPILDLAAQESMPVLDYNLANRDYGRQEYLLPQWLPKALPAIRRQVDDLKDKPGLLMWGMGEEFHSTGEDQAKGLQAVYETLCAADPYRPAFIGDYEPEMLAMEMRSADVGIMWSYPDFMRAGGTRVPLDQLAARFTALWRAMGGRRAKPIIGMPQLFNFGLHYPEGFAVRRAPNYFEMRSMTYQALIHGAAGIGFYDAAYRGGWPGSWVAVKYLGRELAALTPVLLQPDGKPIVQVTSGQVDVLCKQHGTHWTILAVSRSDKPQTARFTVSGLPRLLVAGEGREIKPAGGRFQDDFRPYEARRYTTDPRAWSLPALAAITAECEQADAALAERERDNLACFTHGAHFTLEGEGSYLAVLNDGSTAGEGPYLKGSVTLHLKAPQAVNTVVVSGKLLERWATPQIETWTDGVWRPVEVTRSTQETGQHTVVFEAVTADQVRFGFAGVFVSEIKGYNRQSDEGGARP